MPSRTRAARVSPPAALLALLFTLCLMTACLRQPQSAAPPTAESAGQSVTTPSDPRLDPLRRLRQEGRFDEAITLANRLILRGEREPRDFVERGLTLAAMGHSDRALEDFQSALLLNPKHLEALLAQGDLFFVLEMPAQAEASYSRAIEAAPQNPMPYINRGVARDEQGRFAEAIADYTSALALAPSSALALANRGVARSQLGDVPGMCDDYRRACALGACRRLDDARLMGYCGK